MPVPVFETASSLKTQASERDLAHLQGTARPSLKCFMGMAMEG